jgi:hypothetical protein
MLNWYWGMAVRNMHAVEEAAAGNTYNKADFWGFVGDMKRKDVNDAPMPGNKNSASLRVCSYTKSSKFHSMTSMLQNNKLWVPLLPLPYNYMERVVTFEKGKSNIDSSLWMMQDEKSYATLATLEWKCEAKNREELIENGFKIKKLVTPEWIKKKCGDIFKDEN